MEDIKVSVIVPIYNVEKFISRCVASLMTQTLKRVEFIFVNDATPDRSMEMLHSVMKHYQERIKFVTIIESEKNEGLPAARNKGLWIAKGEYIFHCDSDDYVEPDMLEKLYDAAVKEDADIVWCDWFLSMTQGERYMHQPCFTNQIDAVKAMLSGSMKFNVWNKLVKRSLYIENNIEFPTGYGMGEDMTMIMLFINAEKIAYLPIAFYHYVKTNTTAFSKTYSEQHLKELHYNVNRLENCIREKFGNTFDEYIAYMKLEAKFPFLLSENATKLYLWRDWYPEANRYIMNNRDISFRNRFLQWCAWKNQLWIVRLYSYIFNHIVYGMIYK